MELNSLGDAQWKHDRQRRHAVAQEMLIGSKEKIFFAMWVAKRQDGLHREAVRSASVVTLKSQLTSEQPDLALKLALLWAGSLD